ncbi:dihydroorotase [Anaerosphaera aminiphila DSM 21120]|uniref:Dihydroorotase n=1 Tax=Anaerosphaera aminiphila DSM 21120 TaxID=1120995 RepID=A0A1M5RNP9_9FIRM|nr:dihydroorotase [Anaerosphaera aminiphila]SHH27809.1 dihydroorotase [Anaerosphaera aminiphila DSM 21120]
MIIKNAHIMDPKSNLDGIYDIKINNGIIEKIGKFDEDGLDVNKMIVAPGLVDIHVHFRDPGFTHKEDLTTGSESAAAGGFTSVICMANTNPKIESVDILKEFLKKAEKLKINVHTVSTLTKNFDGENLVDMEEMTKSGAIGFSDDGIPDRNTKVILEAMNRAVHLDVPISFHEEDPSLIVNNGINHGSVSEELGIYGSPSIAEDVLVARDVNLALYTGAKVDIQHISSGNSVELVRWAKKMGANVYAEVTPHHFTLTDEAILKQGTLAKMNPPLRSKRDRDMIIEGLKDNTIEIIATDHAPHTKEEKAVELSKAPSGIIGLETSLGLGIRELVEKGHLTLMDLLRKMTINPAELYNLKAGYIAEGGPADLVIFNPEESYKVEEFKSKSKNSPFIGETLPGKIHYTICKGEIVYEN